MITKEEILKIAKLANLELTEAEIESFTPQISNIIGYLNKLNQVDVTSVEQDFTVLKDTKNRFQEGEPTSLERKDALKNAKEHSDKYFSTDRVL